MTSSSQRNTNKSIDVVCKSEICIYLPGSTDKMAERSALGGDGYRKTNIKFIFKATTIVIDVYSYLCLFLTVLLIFTLYLAPFCYVLLF